MSEKKEMQVQDLSAKVPKPERTNLAPTANGAKMHAWESIRLLLACQQTHERIAQIRVKRTEHKRRREDSHRAVGEASEVIRRLDSEYASLCREEQVKEAETAGVRSRLYKLNTELVGVKSNTRYREISQEIERCKQKVEEFEASELEILARKEARGLELTKARKHLEELKQRHDEESQEGDKALEELDAKEQHEKERLVDLEGDFPDGDEWLKYFRELIKHFAARGERNAVVEVIDDFCSADHLRISTGLRQEARILDHMVTCENCGRIIFSRMGSIRYRLTSEDVEKGRLPLHAQLALNLATESACIRDIWNNRYTGIVDGDWLTGLTSLFTTHALGEGDNVRLSRISDDGDYLFEPDLISDSELGRIIQVIDSSQQPLHLDTIVAEHLKKKLAAYRLKLLSLDLRSRLEGAQGIYFRGDLVWHSPLWELPKPPVIPPLPPRPPRPPIAVSLLPSETTVTLTEDAIGAGEFRISPAFQGRFDGASSGDTVTIKHGVSEAFVVDFDVTAKALKGVALQKWYHFNALEAGDRVTLAVRDAEHRVFHIHTTWKRDFRRLLEQRRKGAAGFAGRPRDLLYGLLVEANQALHYRDLWSRAAELSDLRIGTVVSTLSRYNRRLFCSVGGGRWGLIEWPSEKLQQERERSGGSRVASPLSVPDEEALWRAIHEIEDHDLVYKLLKRAGCDVSYPDIARQLAEMLNVNAEHLTGTSFLNVRDERLQHLANGSWTLKEFVAPCPLEPPPLPEPPAVATREEPRTRVPRPRWLWYVLAALIALAALGWFLATR